MRYLSVCSGIEAASVAWHDFGWTPVGFSEIDAFPSAVLAHRFPHVPNLGDMTKYKEWPLEPGSIDILVGGTPCQSFSVAGLRKGLEDPRGSLMLTYLAIAEHFRIPTLLWENVPGVLSSNGGRDFGAFLGALGELGYRWAYRVLDAQHFGVPQRRRRVFVVARLGDGEHPAEVLFEPESLRGDSAPRRKTRKGSTAALEASIDERGLQRVVGTLFADTHPGAYSGQDAYTGRLVPHINGSHWDDPNAPHPALSQVGTGSGGVGQSNQSVFSQRGAYLVPAEPVAYRKSRRAQSTEDHETWVEDEVANTLNTFDLGDVRTTQAVVQPVAFAQNQVGEIRTNPVMGTLNTNSNATGRNTPLVMAPASQPVVCATGAVTDVLTRSQGTTEDGTGRGTLGIPAAFTPTSFGAYAEGVGTLRAKGGDLGGGSESLIANCALPSAPMVVRRLTPMECERLQGFPDDWTAIPYRGKTAPDGPRYKALGNSMAVPVMRWIGQRIRNA